MDVASQKGPNLTNNCLKAAKKSPTIVGPSADSPIANAQPWLNHPACWRETLKNRLTGVIPDGDLVQTFVPYEDLPPDQKMRGTAEAYLFYQKKVLEG